MRSKMRGYLRNNMDRFHRYKIWLFWFFVAFFSIVMIIIFIGNFLGHKYAGEIMGPIIGIIVGFYLAGRMVVKYVNKSSK